MVSRPLLVVSWAKGAKVPVPPRVTLVAAAMVRMVAVVQTMLALLNDQCAAGQGVGAGVVVGDGSAADVNGSRGALNGAVVGEGGVGKPEGPAGGFGGDEAAVGSDTCLCRY